MQLLYNCILYTCTCRQTVDKHDSAREKKPLTALVSE